MSFARHPLASAALAALVLIGLSACDRKESRPEAKPPAEPAAVPAVPAAAPAAPSKAAAPQRYEATLEEGIKFWLPGLPTTVSEISGLSHHESWGRWSNGPFVTIKFAQPLPPEFVLAVTGAAYGPNVGVPVKFFSGGASGSASFSSELGKGRPEVKQMRFKLAKPSDTIEIRIPKPQVPGGADGRELGIAFIQLQVLKP